MYPRTNYEMTKEDLEKIIASSQPTPCMLIGGYSPSTPQENANRAWAELGKEMGFDHMTVRPIPSKGSRFFTAIPNEPEIQKRERIAKEAEGKRQAEILKLQEEIIERKNRLLELERS